MPIKAFYSTVVIKIGRIKGVWHKVLNLHSVLKGKEIYSDSHNKLADIEWQFSTFHFPCLC